MAEFTTELRSICESLAGLDESTGYNSVNTVIASARPQIFSFDYPIFDDNYRETLETKIIKHYYTREICAETYGRWKLFLDMRMNEIMPYYNKLYESELLQFDPLNDVDYTKSGSSSGNTNGTETGSTQGTKGHTITGSNSSTTDITRSDVDNSTKTDTMTGTVTDSGKHSETTQKTGTESVSEDKSSTRTDNLTKTSTDSGSDTEETADKVVNDHWDYYSDTPQGSVSDLANLNYLTNARHITDDSDGSEKNVTKDYGKVNTTTDTGTTGTVEDNENVTTYDTQDAVSGTDGNTKTYNTTNTVNVTDTLQKTGRDEVSGLTNETLQGSNSETYQGSKQNNTTEEFVEHYVGKYPGRSYMELVKQLRDNFLNIDMLVIRDLGDLFFTLYE